jgi:threonine dehydratase
MTTYSFELDDFRAAELRVQGKIRQTPLLKAQPLRHNITGESELFLKLENLQPTGSFKVRGAINTLMTLTEEQKNKGLITASGGNHGLAVAYAAAIAGVPALIYLPTSTGKDKIKKLQSWGAETQIIGTVWDEANEKALTVAQNNNMTYIHPFSDPRVIHGQGTVSLEILDTNPDIDLLLVAIGGGGLIAGAAAAAKAIKPSIKIIGIEPEGAPTHYNSRKAGKVITLPKIETRAGTLAPRRSDQLNFGLITKHVDEIALVSDAAMEDAARWLWFELGIAAELSGAAAIAAISSGAISITSGSNICSIICGGGTDGLNLSI